MKPLAYLFFHRQKSVQLNVLLGLYCLTLNSAMQLEFSPDRRRCDICPAVLISIFIGSPNILLPLQLSSPHHLSAFTSNSLSACSPASVSKSCPSFSIASAHQVLIIFIAIIHFPPVKVVAVDTSVVTAEMVMILVLPHLQPSGVLS